MEVEARTRSRSTSTIAPPGGRQQKKIVHSLLAEEVTLTTTDIAEEATLDATEVTLNAA
jgi:hypothetical protein